eukprot:1382392-Amorphochlora_amoeboformis.AAC.1
MCVYLNTYIFKIRNGAQNNKGDEPSPEISLYGRDLRAHERLLECSQRVSAELEDIQRLDQAKMNREKLGSFLVTDFEGF